jgi:ferrochelatase
MPTSRLQGTTNYPHGSAPSLGILLTNLGTPDAPTPSALRQYLRQFLWDPRVVEIPRALWWLILNGLVLPLRPSRSAKIYQKIWTPQGSPLLSNMQQLAELLNSRLVERFGANIHLVLGMRYGQPSIASGLEQLRQANAQRILILPLYPQYASATTGSTFDAVSQTLQNWRFVPELRMLNHYTDFLAYIAALTSSVRNHWQSIAKQNHLLFSFHGIPKRAQLAGDPYYCHCLKTARLVAENLGLAEGSWTLAFQSRFGKAEWLQPYCDKTLQTMPSQGIKAVDVICPGFAVDCLETLEEIAMQYKDVFLQAGGQEFNYIPALNASEQHISLLLALIQQQLQGWLK